MHGLNRLNSNWLFRKNLDLKNWLRNVNKTIHIYKNINPWKSNCQLAQYLLNNVLYQQEGLLVVNKPYGITFSRDGLPITPKVNSIIQHKDSGTPAKEIIDKTYLTSGQTNSDISLVKALPYLKQSLGVEKLYIVRVPERYTSGVAILATDSKVVDRIGKCVKRSRPNKEAIDTLLAVVVGKPRYSDNHVTLGLTLDTTDQKKEKKPCLLKMWSNNSVKKGEVEITKFQYKTLLENSNSSASLIQLTSNRRSKHCNRLFCSTYLLAPVLGDNLYGGRVKHVMGVSVPINHWSPASSQPLKLPADFLKALDVPSNESSIIPVHLHVSQVVLRRFKGKSDLVLTAPVPEFFSYTCDRLGLNDPEILEYKATS